MKLTTSVAGYGPAKSVRSHQRRYPISLRRRPRQNSITFRSHLRESPISLPRHHVRKSTYLRVVQRKEICYLRGRGRRKSKISSVLYPGGNIFPFVEQHVGKKLPSWCMAEVFRYFLGLERLAELGGQPPPLPDGVRKGNYAARLLRGP
jgi:hypothetical protein